MFVVLCGGGEFSTNKKRRGTNFEGFKDFNQNPTARTWP
jgi:hypothetical protein